MKDSWPKAAAVLAGGGTTADAARAAAVTPRTVRKWRADEPPFADAIDDGRSRMLSESAGLLASATADAARKLAELIETGAEHHQLRAAQIVLDQAARYRTDRAIEDRIQALELAVSLRPSWQ